MGNKDKTFKKCRRKIRIRLANPNDPNSYICEVFDSSLENENEENDSEGVNFSSQSNEDSSKPRNYFEVLMSNDCRRSNKVKPNAGEQNYEGTFEEKRSKKRQVKQEKIENKLGVKKKVESESSDDENLSQMKNKFQLQNISFEEIEVSDEINDVTEISDSEEELFTIFESPKVGSSKKTLSILNYFSKSTPKNTGDQKKVKNGEEIKNSRINQSNNLVACKNVENSTRSEKKLNKEKKSELNKENVKLAPLFRKREKKIFDPSAQKARLDFLFSSPPVAKKAENKANEKDVKFLEVVHVQQKNDNPCWSPREITLPFRKICAPEFINSPKGEKKFKFFITNPGLIKKSASPPTLQINKDLINKLKSKYANLNLGQVIDNLKRKRDEFRCLSEGLEKTKNSKKNMEADEMGYEVLNTLWIDKYKPSSGDILSNGKVVKKLRDWLESWKSFDEALKALIKSKPGSKCESDDDDDAFVNSDDENYGLKTPGNVCILSGPHGCGKTALVSALANELEFKVLELNASSKRTGKKILSDLQEATQSHKMHRSVLPNGMSVEEPKKKRKRKKGKKSNEATAILPPNHPDCKISLILIEDAEIIFEDHDEGFIPAITSLAQTSKRPLIFITNDPNCAYLDNFKKDQCLMLEMDRACFYKSCAVLDIVSSLEGVHIDGEFLKSLLRQNHFDLRKSLLELQFWTHHIENYFSIRKPFNLGQLWWGLGKFLYKKEFKNCITSKGCKRKRQNDLFDSSDDDAELAVKKPKLNLNPAENVTALNQEMFRGRPNPTIGSYYKILGLISIVDSYYDSSSSEPIFEFECRAKDGLSLEENLEQVDFRRNTLAEELSEELIKLSTGIFAKDIREKKNEERKFDFCSPSWEEIRWQKSQDKVSKELSNLVPLQSMGDKRCLRLDYLPTIRNICRIEKNRAEFQPKRKNRFFHYLSNLGAKFDDCILESCCKVFTR